MRNDLLLLPSGTGNRECQNNDDEKLFMHCSSRIGIDKNSLFDGVSIKKFLLRVNYNLNLAQYIFGTKSQDKISLLP